MSAAATASRIAKATELKPVYLIAGEEHLLVIEAADAEEAAHANWLQR